MFLSVKRVAKPDVSDKMNSHFLKKQTIIKTEFKAIATGGTLYAVIDACDSPSVPSKADELGDSGVVCLFQGEAEEEFRAISPYLFHVTADLLDWIETISQADSWGIFLVANCELERVWRHLRRFTYVRLPDEESVYFRYYDPEVLSKILRVFNRNEVRDLFGPIEAFGCSEKEEWIWLREADTGIPLPLGERTRPVAGGLFQLRQPHLEAFAEETEQLLLHEIMAYLHENHSDSVEDLPHEILIEMTRNGVRRGQQYGLASESSLTAFVASMFEFAPNFDTQRSINLILTDPKIPVENRMEVVLANTRDTVWRKAKQEHDANAWFPELSSEVI